LSLTEARLFRLTGGRMNIHLIDPAIGFPTDTENQLRVLSVPHPTDSKRIITNVVCRYQIAGSEVSFQKNPYDADESFEDAVNWAKSFARIYGIELIYAANMAAGRS